MIHQLLQTVGRALLECLEEQPALREGDAAEHVVHQANVVAGPSYADRTVTPAVEHCLQCAQNAGRLVDVTEQQALLEQNSAGRRTHENQHGERIQRPRLGAGCKNTLNNGHRDSLVVSSISENKAAFDHP